MASQLGTTHDLTSMPTNSRLALLFCIAAESKDEFVHVDAIVDAFVDRYSSARNFCASRHLAVTMLTKTSRLPSTSPNAFWTMRERAYRLTERGRDEFAAAAELAEKAVAEAPPSSNPAALDQPSAPKRRKTVVVVTSPVASRGARPPEKASNETSSGRHESGVANSSTGAITSSTVSERGGPWCTKELDSAQLPTLKSAEKLTVIYKYVRRRWVPFLLLGRSSLVNGEFGLFSLTPLERGVPIGYMGGTIKLTMSTQADAIRASQAMDSSDAMCCFRLPDQRGWHVVDGREAPVLPRLDFINSNKGTGRRPTCMLMQFGKVVAATHIPALDWTRPLCEQPECELSMDYGDEYELPTPVVVLKAVAVGDNGGGRSDGGIVHALAAHSTSPLSGEAPFEVIHESAETDTCILEISGEAAVRVAARQYADRCCFEKSHHRKALHQPASRAALLVIVPRTVRAPTGIDPQRVGETARSILLYTQERRGTITVVHTRNEWTGSGYAARLAAAVKTRVAKGGYLTIDSPGCTALASVKLWLRAGFMGDRELLDCDLFDGTAAFMGGRSVRLTFTWKSQMSQSEQETCVNFFNDVAQKHPQLGLKRML